MRMRFQHWLARKHPGPARYLTVAPFPLQGRPPSIHLVDNQQDELMVSYSAQHHPIDKLPPELLGEIFMRCLPQRCWKPHSPKVHEAPMLLCQICSYWRELALSLPMLWSSFSANLGHRIRAGHVSLIQSWIERSCDQPLFLDLDLRSSDSLMSCMLRLYLANMHRWGNAAFSIDDSSVGDLLAISEGNTHLLESFGINASECTTKAINEISSIFLSFPNLRRLRWYGNSTPTALLGMSFSTLTHIKLLCPLPLNECIRFIARCLQLRDIELDDVEPSSASLTLPIVTLPHLASLYVKNGVSELLDHFTLPSLRSLNFPRLNLQTFENFVSRSSCKLESFYLGDFVRLAEEEVIRCLRMPCLQSLHELGIHARGLTDRTVALLHYSGSEANSKGNILPHLRVFSIETCKTTDGVFSDMIASRWRPAQGGSPASLQWISVSFEGTQHKIDHSRLQEFAAGGLTVS